MLNDPESSLGLKAPSGEAFFSGGNNLIPLHSDSLIPSQLLILNTLPTKPTWTQIYVSPSPKLCSWVEHKRNLPLQNSGTIKNGKRNIEVK